MKNKWDISNLYVFVMVSLVFALCGMCSCGVLLQFLQLFLDKHTDETKNIPVFNRFIQNHKHKH